MRLATAALLVVVVAASVVAALAAAGVVTTCSTSRACRPWNPTAACAIGNRMRLPLVVDASDENVADMLGNGTQDQVVYGFCPQVDQLQAFLMPNSSVWAAGAFRTQSLTAGNTSTYVRIFGAVGADDPDFVPSSKYDASALLFDPNQPCRAANGRRGFLLANFLVINFTLTNGLYRLLPSFSQAVQVGFQPTCSGGVCNIDTKMQCMGGPSGVQNCAVCVTSFDDLVANPVQIFASYYGTDSNGRRFASGASNPLNFVALSSQGVFNSVRNDVSGAALTVNDNLPG
jgi:hypothetical protein